MSDAADDLCRFLENMTQGGLPLLLKYSRRRTDLHPDFVDHLEKALEIAEAQLNHCRELQDPH